MKTDKGIKELQDKIQADLQEMFKTYSFKKKTNNEENRKMLANQATRYLVSMLDLDTISYISSGENDQVCLDLCYKGKKILIDGDMELIDAINKCLMYDTHDLRRFESDMTLNLRGPK